MKVACQAIIIACIACTAEIENGGICRDEITVSFILSDRGFNLTRSVLDDGIETKVTSVVIGAYRKDGTLELSCSYKDASSLEMLLDAGERYDIYALVNMPDIEMPSDVKDVERIEYSVPSYSDINSNGIAMCGVLRDYVPSQHTASIAVERLMAKVSVTVDHTGVTGYEGKYTPDFRNVSLVIRQCNRILRPFAPDGSKALEPDELMADEEGNFNMDNIEDWNGTPGTGVRPGYTDDSTFVFYVPENNWGELLPGNDDPYMKTPEGLEAAGIDAGISSMLTYAEFRAEYDSPENGFGGTLIYRFFLGDDAKKDFSVKRNVHYHLRLGFTMDGMHIRDNWKVTRGQDWTDTRILRFSKGEYRIYAGETTQVEVFWNPSGQYNNIYGMYGRTWLYSFEDRAMQDAGVTYMFDGLRNLFTFTASPSAETGRVFPLSIQACYGTLSDTVNLHVDEVQGDIELDFSKDITDFYLAQIVDVTVSGIDAQRKISYEVTAGDDVIAIYPDGLSSSRKCSISGLKSGLAEITVSNETGTMEKKLILEVKAPELNLDRNDYNLPLDGTEVYPSVYYTDEDGEIIDESEFDEALYNRMLGVDYGLSFNDFVNIGQDNCLFFAKFVNDSGETFEENYGESLQEFRIFDGFDYLVATPYSSSVKPARASVSVSDPFEVSRHLGRIDSYTLVDPSRTSKFEFPMTVNSSSCSWRMYDGSGTPVEKEILLKQAVDRLTMELYRGEEAAYPSGPCKLKGRIRNIHSGEYYESGQAFYLDIFQHAALGGMLSYKNSAAGSEAFVIIDWSHEDWITPDFHNIPSLVVCSAMQPYSWGYGIELYEIKDYINDGERWNDERKKAYMNSFGPDFIICDVEKTGLTNPLRPVQATLPYLYNTGAEYLVIHSYSEFYPDSNGWIGFTSDI